MSDGSTPQRRGEQSFLAENEEMELYWEGFLIDEEENEHSAEFTATNNRLVFSLGGGHFKDIGFQHIESVEVATDVVTKSEGTDPDEIIGFGGVGILAGLFGMGIGGFSALSILGGLTLIGLGGYAIFWASENYDRLEDEREVTEHQVYHILMRTNATSPFSFPIYFETMDNVGPDLSRLVQSS